MSAGSGSSSSGAGEVPPEFREFLDFLADPYPLGEGAEIGGDQYVQQLKGAKLHAAIPEASLGPSAFSAAAAGAGAAASRTHSLPVTKKDMGSFLKDFIEKMRVSHEDIVRWFYLDPSRVSKTRSLGSEDPAAPKIDEEKVRGFITLFIQGQSINDIDRDLSELIRFAAYKGYAERAKRLTELQDELKLKEREWTGEKYRAALKKRYALMDFLEDVREYLKEKYPDSSEAKSAYADLVKTAFIGAINVYSRPPRVGGPVFATIAAPPPAGYTPPEGFGAAADDAEAAARKASTGRAMHEEGGNTLGGGGRRRRTIRKRRLRRRKTQRRVRRVRR